MMAGAWAAASLFSSSYQALSFSMCARWFEPGTDLPVFPLQREAAPLLPGEQQHLSFDMNDDEPLLLALEHANTISSGFCAQHTDEAGSVWHTPKLATLLQLCNIIEPEDAGGQPGQVIATVKCVGRLKVLSPAAPATNKVGITLGFDVLSSTSAFSDDFRRLRDSKSSLAATRAHLANMDAVTEALEGYTQLESELRCLRGERDQCNLGPDAFKQRRWRLTPKSEKHQPASRRQVRRFAPAREPSGYSEGAEYETLERRAKDSLAILLQNEVDEQPESTLRKLHELWGVDLEVDAQRQVISWAACGWLGAEKRFEALLARDAGSRLQIAASGIREIRQARAAELAMERVILHAQSN